VKIVPEKGPGFERSSDAARRDLKRNTMESLILAQDER
jgi:hypothetical protein